MTRLGIVVALAAEARTLGLSRYRRSELIPLSQQVVVCVSGIGPARARVAGERLIAHGADAILSWGTAAALDNKLAPGHLVLPHSVVSTDRDPGPVSRDWRQQLHDRLGARFPVSDQPLLETNHVLVQPAQKQRLFQESGAAAADMESAELSAVARDAAVPFAALRVIADSADTTIPQWITGSIDSFGRVRLVSMLLPFITHPADWPGILRLARDFRAAFNTLHAIGADGACAELKPVFPAAANV